MWFVWFAFGSVQSQYRAAAGSVILDLVRLFSRRENFSATLKFRRCENFRKKKVRVHSAKNFLCWIYIALLCVSRQICSVCYPTVSKKFLSRSGEGIIVAWIYCCWGKRKTNLQLVHAICLTVPVRGNDNIRPNRTLPKTLLQAQLVVFKNLEIND